MTFAWDETGNRTLLADATGRTTWLYDALNRTRVNRQPNSKTLTYSYDAVSNRREMVPGTFYAPQLRSYSPYRSANKFMAARDRFSMASPGFEFPLEKSRAPS